MNTEFNISKIFVGNTAPTNVAKGKLWLDTSVSPSQLKESNGTTWINCGATVTIDNITLPVESVIENIGLELELKQNKTDNTLTTSSKTIVGAINELVDSDHNINEVLIEHDNTLTTHTGQIAKAEDDIASINTKLLADVPAPITDVFTSASTSLTSIITDTTKKDIQGKILMSPNINNLGAIYVGQSVTDKTKAFPLYPNQIVSFSFTDITDFKVATDILGDKFNYVVEFGVLNSAVTPAEGLIIVGTDGSKYRLNPLGDVGSETFTLTKIS